MAVVAPVIMSKVTVMINLNRFIAVDKVIVQLLFNKILFQSA
jgi:hypothetical protein